MKRITFTTPTGNKVDLYGAKPYYSLRCNFHATKEKEFMETLEKDFFVRSIAFRDNFSTIQFSDRAMSLPSDVADKIKHIVEKKLI